MPIMTRTSAGIYKKVNKIYDLAGNEISKVYDVAGNLIYQNAKDILLNSVRVYLISNYLLYSSSTYIGRQTPQYVPITDSENNYVYAKNVVGKRFVGKVSLFINCGGYPSLSGYNLALGDIGFSKLNGGESDFTSGIQTNYKNASYDSTITNLDAALPTAYKTVDDVLTLQITGTNVTVGADAGGRNRRIDIGAYLYSGAVIYA